MSVIFVLFKFYCLGYIFVLGWILVEKSKKILLLNMILFGNVVFRFWNKNTIDLGWVFNVIRNYYMRGEEERLKNLRSKFCEDMGKEKDRYWMVSFVKKNLRVGIM